MCFSFSLWICNTVKQMGGGYVYMPIRVSYQHLFYHHRVYAWLHDLNGMCVLINSASICTAPQTAHFSC